MSCAGNGYLSGNEIIPFPFEDGQSLAWEGLAATDADKAAAQMALESCFVDCEICIRAESMPDGWWPKTSQFSCSEGMLEFNLVYGDCETEIRVLPSEKFPVISEKTPWGAFVMVFSSRGIKNLVQLCSDLNVSPPHPGSSSPVGADGDCSLRICTKCITLEPVGVSSIKVYDGVHPKSSGPHFVIKGDISVKPGYNMFLSEPNSASGVSLNASPGAGLGRLPCYCADEVSVNPSIFSPDGHVRIFNDTCYDLEPCDTYAASIDGKIVRSRTLKIHAKCTACCTCSMYESIVNDKLARIAESIRDSKAAFDDMHSRYEDAVGLFNNRISHPTLSDFSMSLSGMPSGYGLGSKLNVRRNPRDTPTVSGKMNRCAFLAMIKNRSFRPAVVKLREIYGNDYVAEATASWTDNSGETRNVTTDNAGIIREYFEIGPGGSVAITFVTIKEGMVTSITSGGYIGRVSAAISYINERGETEYLGVLNKTVEV